MYLECRFTAPVCRDDLDAYVREVEVDVTCYDADIADRFLVGRLSLNQVLWARALAERVSPFDVCDDDSQGLYEVYMALTKGKGQFRGDLRLRGSIEHVLFMHRAVLHPDLRRYRRGVLDAALALFGADSLAVLWRRTGDFTEAELAELGFARIARTGLIYRHSARRSTFRAANPRGQTVDLAATAAHREWVEREWARIVAEEEGPSDG